MTFTEIEDILKECGCRPVHIEKFWRNWFSGRPLTEADFRFPDKLEQKLPKLKAHLEGIYSVVAESSSEGGGAKLLLKARDGELVESVILPKNGLCVSTQVGCAVGCIFCMTGRSGLIRQITDLEIAAQFVIARKKSRIKRVVFMGMGEPSHNMRAVLSAVDYLARFARIGYKDLVVSTVGDQRLFEEILSRDIKPALAVSLHSAFDEKRSLLLPKAPRLSVSEIFDFTARYAKVARYPVQFQWTLIEGVNDAEDEILRLASFWPDQFAVLNMIPVNSVEGSSCRRPSGDKIDRLKVLCKEKGILLKFRESAAQDVSGGCGQLRAGRLKSEE